LLIKQPQVRKVTEAVGVNVFGTFDPLCEGRDRRLSSLGFGGVDVEQNGAMVEDRPLGAIALDNQRIVGGIGQQAQDRSAALSVLIRQAFSNRDH
jgi:hypothetical protein